MEPDCFALWIKATVKLIMNLTGHNLETQISALSLPLLIQTTTLWQPPITVISLRSRLLQMAVTQWLVLWAISWILLSWGLCLQSGQ
jgi:hypothetical protein